ncbi:MAG: PAS domain-containing sensor histidine kinase, partial [Calditrichaeota bacterium]|nr:PAS domain-containing sensor histidine kinase [Calditrichota bacterium]
MFQEEDLALVESFTLFASIAINNARIHQELIGQIAERQQAEEALRKSAEKYKDLTENLNVGVYRNTIGSKGKFIELNSAFVKMFGYDSKDEIGQLNVSDLYQDADDRAVFNKKMVKSGYVSNEELNLIKKDGTPFIGSISSVAVKDKNGKVKYYDGIVENITERKRVEAALRESEARNKAIVAALPDIIFRLDADGRFVDVAVNDPNLLLIPPEKVLGKKARKILPPDLAELTEIKIRKTLRTGQMQVFEYDLGLGNEIRNFEARMVTCSENEVMSIIRDNTERKRAEEALKERERFHRGLLDDMVSFVAVLKPDGEVIFVNNTPLKVGGFELEDVVGQKFYNCAWWTHSDEVRQTVKKYIEQCACGETLIHDIQIQTTDGSLMWIEYSMHPYFDKNGSVIYLIPEGRDITERKQAEEERVQALQEARQANKVKDLFITNMSHEIRTPLNSLLGFTEIIREIFKDRMDEEENEYFQIVNSSGQRLINTVHDILDISRIEAGVFPDNPRVVRLATPIESLFKEFRPVATAKNLKLTYANQIDDGAVKVDEACIVKAVSNLVDNAIKFTEEGQIKILLNEQNSKYVLAISDTGIGIGADYLNQLYDAFSQEST